MRKFAVRRYGVVAACAAMLGAGVFASVPQAATAASVPATKQCPYPSTTILKTTPARYSRTVALTFDDGPSKYTPAILDVLKHEGVHATFFVTGAHVKANPTIAKRIVAEGHILGNHTYSHPQAIAGSVPYGRFSSLSKTVQASQMDTTTSVIKAATGTRPCFFRAPGGWASTTTTVPLSRARGMAVVNWSHDTEDWAQPGYLSSTWKSKITARATSPVYYHPIILMHDGKASVDNTSAYRGNTVAALTGLIRWYKARGYVFTDPAGYRL